MVVIRGRRCHGEGSAREQGHSESRGWLSVSSAHVPALSGGRGSAAALLPRHNLGNAAKLNAVPLLGISRLKAGSFEGVTVSISYSRAGSSTSSLQEQLGLYFAHFLPETLGSREHGAGTAGWMGGRLRAALHQQEARAHTFRGCVGYGGERH